MKEMNDNFKSVLGRIKKTDHLLMETLEKIHEDLESLEKKLINYLERKRKTFPR